MSWDEDGEENNFLTIFLLCFILFWDIQMSTSILVATFLAPVMGLVTLSLFINQDWVGKIAKEYSKSNVLVYVMWVLQVFSGMVLIHYHNVRAWDWALVITLLGWANLIKWAISLLAPSRTMSMVWGMKFTQSTSILYGLICGIITVILAYMIYMG